RARIRLGRRRAVVARPGAPTLLTVARDLALELVDELVDRRLHVVGGLACSERRTLGPDRPLGDVARRDRRVPLDAQLDLHLGRVGELPLELAELLLGIAADRLADLEVLAFHLEPHAFSFSPGTSC